MVTMLSLFEPMHPVRKAWDVLRLLAVLWEGFVTPVSAVGRNPFLYLAVAWPDLVFFLKVPVDFNTRAYTRFGGRTETRADIVRFRVGPNLWIELFAAIPFHILAWALAQYTAPFFVVDGLDISLVVHLLGVVRITYLFGIIERLWGLYHIDHSKLLPAKQTVSVLLALHWFGIPLLYMNGIYVERERGEKSFYERYLFVLYFTASTFIPVGYGDLSMRSSDTRLFVILLMAMGAIAFLLWTVSIVRLNLEERLRNNPVSGRPWAIGQYLTARECGPKLERMIQDWFLFRIRNFEKDYFGVDFNELPPSYRAVISEQLAGLTLPNDCALFYDLLQASEIILPPKPDAFHFLKANADRFYIVTCGKVLCYDPETRAAVPHGPGFTFGGMHLASADSVCEIACCPGCELLILDLMSVRRIVNASSLFRPALREAVRRYSLAIPDQDLEVLHGDQIAGSAVLALVDRLSARECRAVLRTTESRQMRLHFHHMFRAALAKVLERYEELHGDLQEILLRA